MPLLRPGLPPVYHEGEKREPLSINATPVHGSRHTRAKDLPKPAPQADIGGPDLTSPGATSATAIGPATANQSGTNTIVLPGSTPDSETRPLVEGEPTPQSEPDVETPEQAAARKAADQHWKRKQARLAREREQGQNAGGDTLLK